MQTNWQDGKTGVWQLCAKESKHVTWTLRNKELPPKRLACCVPARTRPPRLTSTDVLPMDKVYGHSNLLTGGAVLTGKTTFKVCLVLEVLEDARNTSTNTPNWLKPLWKRKVFFQRGKAEGAELLLLVGLFSLRCRTETPALTDFRVLI